MPGYASKIRPPITTVRRFLAVLETVRPTTGGCLEWPRCRVRRGYGRIGSSYRGTTFTYYTHRIAWVAARGAIPNGMFVLHACDNPPCVNIKHLWLGTTKDNVRDSASKGRMHLGERNGMARITSDIAVSIRCRHSNGEPMRSIADTVGISHASVSRVVRRETWRHV